LQPCAAKKSVRTAMTEVDRNAPLFDLKAKRIYVAMEHVAKNKPKILKKCALPLTRPRCVHHIVTDLAFIDVTPEGLLLREVAKGVTPEQVQAVTEPRLRIAPDLREMPV